MAATGFGHVIGITAAARADNHAGGSPPLLKPFHAGSAGLAEPKADPALGMRYGAHEIKGGLELIHVAEPPKRAAMPSCQRRLSSVKISALERIDKSFVRH